MFFWKNKFLNFSDSSAAGFAESLPVLIDHLAFLDRSIQRPLREYNDCQVLYHFIMCKTFYHDTIG